MPEAALRQRALPALPRARGPRPARSATPNQWPVPTACADPDCGGEELRYLAFLPAKVSYEGKRADKARSSIEPHDDGFHGVRAECRACRQAVSAVDRQLSAVRSAGAAPRAAGLIHSPGGS